MEWQERTISISDGQLVWYEAGTGPTVLFLSGGPGDDHQYLRPLAAPLTDKWRCILLDQRGVGKSLLHRKDAETVSLPRFLDDLEQLRVSRGLERRTLAGHPLAAPRAATRRAGRSCRRCGSGRTVAGDVEHVFTGLTDSAFGERDAVGGGVRHGWGHRDADRLLLASWSPVHQSRSSFVHPRTGLVLSDADRESRPARAQVEVQAQLPRVVLVVDQPRALHKDRFGEDPLTSLTVEEMTAVEHSLKGVLGLL